MRHKNMPRQLNRFARHRMARGLTQKKLAQLMGVRPSTVCAWEAGLHRPDPERIPKLAEHLRVDALQVAEFFDGSEL
jgi:transcriptional regulator with XRE-family HTH domain